MLQKIGLVFHSFTEILINFYYYYLKFLKRPIGVQLYILITEILLITKNNFETNEL